MLAFSANFTAQQRRALRGNRKELRDRRAASFQSFGNFAISV
jgi:hypothetical protein